MRRSPFAELRATSGLSPAASWGRSRSFDSSPFDRLRVTLSYERRSAISLGVSVANGAALEEELDLGGFFDLFDRGDGLS